MTMVQAQSAGGAKSFLAQWLDERHIDPYEGVKRCGIDPQTYWCIYDGSVTFPSFALKMGENLGMNREEVQHIGQALNKKVWTTTEGLSYPDPVDVNQHWFNRLKEGTPHIPVKEEPFLSRRKLAEALFEKNIDGGLFFYRHAASIKDGVTRGCKDRTSVIRSLAALAGVAPERISTDRYYNKDTVEAHSRPVWRVNIDRLEICRATAGLSIPQAGRRYSEKAAPSRKRRYSAEAWNEVLLRFSFSTAAADTRTILALEYALGCDRSAFAHQEFGISRTKLCYKEEAASA